MFRRIIGAVLLIWCVGIVAGCETTKNQDLFSPTSRQVVGSQPKS